MKWRSALIFSILLIALPLLARDKSDVIVNKWFGNVELMAAKDIGQETVQYVSSVYKYYIAYKMALEQKEIRKKAMESVAKP